MKRILFTIVLLMFSNGPLEAMISQASRQSSARFAAWLRSQTPRAQQQVYRIIHTAELTPEPAEEIARQVSKLRGVKDRSLDVVKLEKNTRPLYRNAFQDPRVLRAADEAFVANQLDYQS